MGLKPYTNENFCYLTTTGRVTGRPHEIWFSTYNLPQRVVEVDGGAYEGEVGEGLGEVP
jgi:hypothetical protein